MAQIGYDNLQLAPKTTEGQVKTLVSRTYRGFSTVATEHNPSLYDLQLIKQDLINHFHIRKGEKLNNPDFGTIIWDMLFEPMTETSKTLIINDVTEIINSDPRTKVNKVVVTTKEQGIQIEIELVYLPYNIQEKLQFIFDRNNGLI